MLVDLPDTADVEPVFRGITDRRVFLRTGQLLPQHVPILLARSDSSGTQRCSLVNVIPMAGGIVTYGEEFAFAALSDTEHPHDTVWLYLLFNAGVVASFTGKVSAFPFPPATKARGCPRKR